MSGTTPSTADEKRARLKQWLTSGEVALHPLTLPQRELWEASPVPPGSSANHICCVITVNGALTQEDCRAAIQAVVDRQHALRISILPGKERPLQMVRRSAEVSFAYRVLPEGANDADAVEARAQEVFSEPFDLVQGPLYRVEMMCCGENRHVLAFAIHHSIADGWTLGVFVQDLVAAYLQITRKLPGPMPALTQSYIEWGAAERALWSAEEVAKRLPFWKTQLAGSQPLWKAPEGKVVHRLNRIVSGIGKELAASAKELAKRQGATQFSVLLSAFYITLHAWRGMDDMVVGSPVANRKKSQERETMGYYAGNVPLRAKVTPTASFTSFLSQVHGTVMDAFENAIPFVELANALEGGKCGCEAHPIYDTRFALQNHPVPDVDLPGISARLRMRSTGTARFYLGCEVTEMDNALEVVWLINTALFARSDADALDRIFRSVLTVVCAKPETVIADITDGLRQ